MATITEYLDPAYQQRDVGELAELPMSALRGASAENAALLEQALGIRTIRQFAEHSLVRAAQAITLLADGRSGTEEPAAAHYRQRLRELGLVAETRSNGAPPTGAERTPIEVQGRPLSEVILEERR